jgi:hypothetical protein
MAARKILSCIATFIVGAILCIQVACTDREATAAFPTTFNPASATTGSLQYMANIQFEGFTTDVDQMIMVGSTMFLTGTPFGFMRLDIGPNSANALSPTLTFDAKDNMTAFSPYPGNPSLGFWDPTELASNALAVIGPFSIMSGTFGASLVNISQTNMPVEVYRYPLPQNQNQGADAAFEWNAVVAHPTLPLLYAFRQQDYMMTYNVTTTAPYLTLAGEYPYSSSGTVCCVAGGTEFMNMVALAMTTRIWFFNMGTDGSLSNWVESDALQATAIAASADHLYIYHSPSESNPNGAAYPRGIYAINESGNADAYFPVENVQVFAVSQDNNYLFDNEDDTQIKIYQLNWESAGVTARQDDSQVKRICVGPSGVGDCP